MILIEKNILDFIIQYIKYNKTIQQDFQSPEKLAYIFKKKVY